MKESKGNENIGMILHNVPLLTPCGVLGATDFGMVIKTVQQRRMQVAEILTWKDSIKYLIIGSVDVTNIITFMKPLIKSFFILSLICQSTHPIQYSHFCQSLNVGDP